MAQCYGINGQRTTGTPCNSAATGQGNSHSSCCDGSKQEACLSTGLCYASQRGDNQTFWAEGCTDPTGMDPACQSVCGRASPFIAIPVQSTYTLLACSTTTWCCCSDNLGVTCDKTECCSRNFTMARGFGTVTRQLSNIPGTSIDPSVNTATATACSDTNCTMTMPMGMRLMPIIAAALLGLLLLCTIVAFGLSCTQNRRLRRQVEMLQASLGFDGNGNSRGNGGSISERRLKSAGGNGSETTSIKGGTSTYSSPRASLTVPPPLLLSPAPKSSSTIGNSNSNNRYPPTPRQHTDDDREKRSPLVIGTGAAQNRRDSYPELIRTPRTPITAAYHHHLAMVNQALSPHPSSISIGASAAPTTPGQQQKPHYFHFPQQQSPKYAVVPSPGSAGTGSGRRPSWPRNFSYVGNGPVVRYSEDEAMPGTAGASESSAERQR